MTALSHAANAGRHPLTERGADLYETPACAVEALLRVETLPHRIWEPAAGRGAIVNVLRDRGHAVIAGDVVDYGFPLHLVADFLMVAQAPAGCEIVLARLALLESTRRTEILERRGLARVHVFRNRLPFMHRDGWSGPRASSGIPFAWFRWERGYAGPAAIDRI